MVTMYPKKLTERISLIDGFDMGMSERTGTYVIDEEQLTLIETGPSPSIPHIVEGLEQLGHSAQDVAYIIVTHIHLDHAGGAGLLLKQCPNAKVVVHPKGARHLSNPSRLVAGAKAVYGERFSPLFDPVVPIDAERLLVKGEGDSLQIGPGCMLEFWDSPGHANHHFAIIDPISNGIFSGDTAGILYEQLAKEQILFSLPSTSPNQFDPDNMRQSVNRMKAAKFTYAFYGHFGMTDKPEQAFSQSLEWLDIFMEQAGISFSRKESHIDLAARLKERVSLVLAEKGIPENHEVYMLIELDLMVSAMGLLDYLNKNSH